jgi:hypothetical protein
MRPSSDSSASPNIGIGDFVRLKRDEPGPLVTAFSGDWGKVLRINSDGSVDLQLAGYSRPRTDPASRAMAVPRGCVEPCDGFGRKLLLDLRHWAGAGGRGR